MKTTYRNAILCSLKGTNLAFISIDTKILCELQYIIHDGKLFVYSHITYDSEGERELLFREQDPSTVLIRNNL